MNLDSRKVEELKKRTKRWKNLLVEYNQTKTFEKTLLDILSINNPKYSIEGGFLQIESENGKRYILPNFGLEDWEKVRDYHVRNLDLDIRCEDPSVAIVYINANLFKISKEITEKTHNFYKRDGLRVIVIKALFRITKFRSYFVTIRENKIEEKKKEDSFEEFLGVGIPLEWYPDEYAEGYWPTSVIGLEDYEDFDRHGIIFYATDSKAKELAKELERNLSRKFPTIF